MKVPAARRAAPVWSGDGFGAAMLLSAPPDQVRYRPFDSFTYRPLP